jgi:hypothetical protein
MMSRLRSSCASALLARLRFRDVSPLENLRRPPRVGQVGYRRRSLAFVACRRVQRYFLARALPSSTSSGDVQRLRNPGLGAVSAWPVHASQVEKQLALRGGRDLDQPPVAQYVFVDLRLDPVQ